MNFTSNRNKYMLMFWNSFIRDTRAMHFTQKKKRMTATHMVISSKDKEEKSYTSLLHKRKIER